MAVTVNVCEPACRFFTILTFMAPDYAHPSMFSGFFHITHAFAIVAHEYVGACVAATHGPSQAYGETCENARHRSTLQSISGCVEHIRPHPR